jgi:hypothetical protein
MRVTRAGIASEKSERQFQKTEFSISASFERAPNLTDVSETQCAKQDSPSVVTVAGTVTIKSEPQSEKADSPMRRSEDGDSKATRLSDLQDRKQPFGMIWTEPGMQIESRE